MAFISEEFSSSGATCSRTNAATSSKCRRIPDPSDLPEVRASAQNIVWRWVWPVAIKSRPESANAASLPQHLAPRLHAIPAVVDSENLKGAQRHEEKINTGLPKKAGNASSVRPPKPCRRNCDHARALRTCQRSAFFAWRDRLLDASQEWRALRHASVVGVSPIRLFSLPPTV
jgi:hypothetical protein